MTADGAPACGAERRRFLALLAGMAGALALGGAARAQSSPDGAAACRTLYLAGHARHTGIIVDRRDFDPVQNADSPEFLAKDWLELGWGDAAFYQADGEGILLGIKALFLSAGAVVHVHGFNGAPAANFPKSEVLELRLTADGYARLLAFLKSAFTRDAAGRVKRLGSGLYGLSFFYAGEGTYHAFHNCNTWAAEALAAGGFPIDTAGVIIVGQVMDRVRGETVPACAVEG
jgi:uncharacterized protein (TIGR02117 family)